jgi:hypothetical protein
VKRCPLRSMIDRGCKVVGSWGVDRKGSEVQLEGQGLFLPR